ncbi:hypothetical protein BGX29_006923 [Mortierella sp. GBA35]|nr:hypothetical protein BGX29_006923 [Mortierella sp. GBA35]
MAIISTLVASFDLYTFIATLFALLSSYIFFKVYVLPNYVSPLRHIPGPPNKSKYNKYNIPCAGLFFDVLRQEAGVPYREWIEQYGGIVCYRGMFNTQNVLLADPQAIQHVFGTHAYKYPKPDRVIRLMSSVIGKGLLLAEGDVHRKQRKMINPAFSHKNIKDMVPSMIVPAEYLAKMWEDRVDRSEDKSIELNIVPELSSCALDIIGLAGFGFDFQALTMPENDLVKAFSRLFGSSNVLGQFLRNMVPYYTLLPFKHNRERSDDAEAIDRVSDQIIREKRAQAIATNPSYKSEGKDLMSILMRANDKFGSLEVEKLTDAELKAQVTTFMAAGHETSSVTAAWMLHALSTHQDVQKKLRQELLAHFGRPSDDNRIPLTYDALSSLPYLNACVKELFRYISPIHTTSRIATEDDNILGYDIPKGTHIYLSSAALHKLKYVFGEDADEFKPERWMDPKLLTEEQRNSTIFVTSDMIWAYLPFLTGPRNCIGSKFAIIETKIILYHLLVNLEYHPVPGFKFRKSARITLRPYPGMNLIIKRFSGDTTEKEP